MATVHLGLATTPRGLQLTIALFLLSLTFCFGTGGSIAYVKHRRELHRPDYAEIARLERELGFSIEPATPPLKALTQHVLKPGWRWEVTDHNHVQIIQQPYVASAYYASAGPMPLPKPRVLILGPNGKPL